LKSKPSINVLILGADSTEVWHAVQLLESLQIDCDLRMVTASRIPKTEDSPDLCVVCSPNCEDLTCPKIIVKVKRRYPTLPIFLFSDCDCCDSLLSSPDVWKALLKESVEASAPLAASEMPQLIEYITDLCNHKMRLNDLSEKIKTIQMNLGS